MADLMSIFGLGTTDQDIPEGPGPGRLAEKQAAVEQTSAAKRMQMDPQAVQAQDAALMDNEQYAAKYGPAAMLIREAQKDRIRIEESTALANRSGGERVKDSVIAMGRSTAGMLAGMEAKLLRDPTMIAGTGSTALKLPMDLARAGELGEGAQSAVETFDETSAKAYNIFQRYATKADEGMKGAQSKISQYNEDQVGRRIEARTSANAEEQREAIARGDSELLSGAKRVGKDILAGAGENLDNPTVLSNAIVGQVPTLAIGGVSKAAVTTEAVAAKAMLLAERRAIAKGAGSMDFTAARVTPALQREAADQLARRNLAVGVGATEGAGAYQGAASEIVNMPMADLQKAFPDENIAARIAAGESEEQIRMELADNAGNVAAAIAAPLSAVATKLAAKFELNPVGSAIGEAGETLGQRAGTIVGNVAGEGAEELVQSGGGQLASNLGRMAVGDESVDPLAGVGESAGAGAVTGAGMAGVFQAPGAAKLSYDAGVPATLAVVKKGAKAILDPIIKRGENIKREISEKQAAEQREYKSNFAPRATDVVTSVVESGADATPWVEPADTSTISTEARGAMKLGEGEKLTKLETIGRAIAATNLEGLTESVRTDLVLVAAKHARELQPSQQALLDEIEATPEGPQRDLMVSAWENINSFVRDPVVENLQAEIASLTPEAVERYTGLLENVPMSEVSEQTLARVVEIAYAAPEVLTPGQVQKVLFQKDKLPEQDVVQLNLANEFAKVIEAHKAAAAATKEQFPNSKTPDEVREEILTKGFQPRAGGDTMPSLATYVKSISGQMAVGNVQVAKLAMAKLADFAAHFDKRANAFDETAARIIESGDMKAPLDVEIPMDVQYGDSKTLDADGNLSNEKFKLNLSSDGSRETISNVFTDRNSVAATYNALAKQFPGLIKASQGDAAPLPSAFNEAAEPTWQKLESAEAARLVREERDAKRAAAAPKAAPAPKKAAPAADAAVDELPSDEDLREENLLTEKPGATAPAPTPAPEPEVIEVAPPADTTGKKTVYAKTKAGTFRLTDEIAPAGSDFSEFGEVRIIEAFDGDQKVGQLLYANDGTPPTVEVDESHQRRGIATAMYKLARQQGGVLGDAREGIRSNSKQYRTEQGQAFRQNANEDAVELADEAPVEEVVEAAPVLEAPPQTMGERFSGVIVQAVADGSSPTEQLKLQNRFLGGFKLRKNATALFARFKNPLQLLSDRILAAWSVATTDEANQPLPDILINQNSFVRLDGTQLSALRTIFDQVVPNIVAQLNSNLDNAAKGLNPDGSRRKQSGTGKAAQGWLNNLFPEGKDPQWIYANRQSLHATELTEDGIKYNDEIANGLAAAAIDWVVSNINTPIVANMEDLLKQYPLGVPDELLEAYNTMLFHERPLRDIARKFADVLGIQEDTTAPANWADGIGKSLAGDALHALASAGIIEIVPIKIGAEYSTTSNDLTAITFIRFVKEDAEGESVMQLLTNQLKSSSLIRRILTPDATDMPLFAPTTQVNHRVRGADMELSPDQITAVKKNQGIKHWRNGPFTQFLRGISASRLRYLLGAIDLDPVNLVPAHARMVRGVNLGIDNSIINMDDFDGLWQQKADELGTSVDDVPVYFSFDVTSNGRLMMNESTVNPQANKLVRELMTPYKVTLDLVNNDKHIADFYMALSQAMGINSVTNTNNAAITQVGEILNSPAYMEAAEAIIELMDADPGEAQQDLGENVAQIIDELRVGADGAFQLPAGARALHALVTWARFEKASREGTLDQFDNYLPFEVDGKTDGPINGLVHFGMHSFGKRMINQLQQGGLILNNMVEQTLNALGNIGDIYKTAAARLEAGLQSRLRDPDATQEDTRRLKAALNLMERAKYVSQDPEDISAVKANRSVAKGAVVTMGYGSSARTVIQKLAYEMLDVVYADMSEAMAEGIPLDGQMQDALRLMMTRKRNPQNKEKWVPVKLADLNNLDLYKKWNFTPDNITAFIDNLTENGGAMLAFAVESEMAPILESFTMLYAASALQTAALKQAYDKAAAARKAELIAEGKMLESDALSKVEDRKIYESLQELAPNYPLGHSSEGALNQGISGMDFDQTGTHIVNGKPYKVNSIIGGPVSMDINTRTLLYPGVRAAALLTIGSGDANMMTQVAKDNDIEGTLNVYDGWEVAPGQLAERGLQINKAVADGWRVNVMQGVADSFDRMEMDYDAMSSEERVALAHALRIYNYKIDPKDYPAMFRAKEIATRAELRHAAKIQQATMEVLFEEVPMAVDHMSGTEAPWTNGVTELLSEPVDEYVARRVAEKMGVKEDVNGDDSWGRDYVVGRLRKIGSENKVLQFVAKSIARLVPQDIVVYRGTPAEMLAKQKQLFPDAFANAAESKGAYYQKTLFLSNESDETFVHELVHATTYHLVQQARTNPKALSVHQRDAVASLEKLAKSFATMNFTSLTEEQADEVAHVQMVVTDYLLDGDIAEATNEFMAWALTNPVVGEALSGMSRLSEIKALAKKVINFVRMMLDLPKNNSVESFLEQTMGQFHRLVRRDVDRFEISSSALFQSLPEDLPSEHANHVNTMVEKFKGMLLGRANTTDGKASVLAALNKSRNIVESFLDAGFKMSDRERVAFRLIQATFAANMQLDPNSIITLQRMRDDVMEKLTPSDLQDNPQSQDPADIAAGQDRYNALRGIGTTVVDADGRSNSLANFVAMALTNKPLRGKLTGLKMPAVKKQTGSADERLRGWAEAAFNWVGGVSTRVGGAPNQRFAMEKLVTRIAEIEEGVQRQLNNKRVDPLKLVESKIGDLQAKADEKVLDKLNSRIAQQGAQATKVEGWINGALAGVRGLLSDEGATAFGESFLSMLNHESVPKVVRDFGAELVGGGLPSNAELTKLLTKAKYAVSRVRQRLREEAPKDVRKMFKREMTEQDWTTMHKVVGRTDMASLMGSYNSQRLIQILQNSVDLDDEVARLVARLGPQALDYSAAALDLAEHNMLGKASGHGPILYANADAIARFLGQGFQISEADADKAAKGIDRLVTLFSLSLLQQSEKDFIVDMLANEKAGMEGVLNVVKALTANELRKPEATSQRFNRWKGHIPYSLDPRSELRLAPTKEGAKLLAQGYRKVADYVPDVADRYGSEMAYYALAKAGGQQTYNQGALQTVEGSVGGVDGITGRTLDPSIATTIGSPFLINEIKQQRELYARLGKTAPHSLRPVFKPDGSIKGYERILDRELLDKHLQGKRDMADAIGMWIGRQAEEQLARQVNQQLAIVLRDSWLRDKDNVAASKEYVDIRKTGSKTGDDTWATVPRETQNLLTSVFGDEPIMVRRDQLNNALGYRSASVGDVFTQVSDLPKPVRESIETAAYGLLGKNAYKYLVTAERSWQAIIGQSKDFIVVRSGIVAVANILANQLQMLAMGIPASTLLQKQARKVNEVARYLRNEKRLAAINLELLSTRDSAKKSALEREVIEINDINSRLSIMPLIRAGELPSIAEGLSEQDEYSILSDFTHWMEEKTKQLPESVKTIGRYAVISKETALYQGLNRTIQFGDFMAKATLYDHLMSQGMPESEVLARVNDSFVNYSLLPGRTRDYAESVGATWFWNYKLRIQKIALRTARENPLRFLLASVGGSLTGTDTLLSSAAPNINWGYSMGLDPLWRSHDMILWNELFN